MTTQELEEEETMAGDWFSNLDDEERREWDSFVEYVRRETLTNMSKSSAVISFAPAGKPDVKFCVELGMSVMLDKPIVVVIAVGQVVPGKLRKVADEIIEADIDTEAGRDKVAKRLDKFIQKM